ncbi:MAG TPA: response regulator transcription factor [bacterium]|nr:response regulator transcription factor [bacterium]
MNTSKKILIVEDDPNISKLVEYNLQKSGFKTTSVDSGEKAIAMLQKDKFHLAILDIMLPGMDGLEICKKIKNNKKLSDMKILILTAKGEEVDKVLGFELGVDDYVVKPFSPRELVLRVKAILRRNETVKDLILCDGIKIDVKNHDVFVDNKKTELTAMEFKLLVTLVENKGNVQTRDYLLEEVWSSSSDITTRTIDTHIKRLRQKIGKYGKKIETVRSLGYRYID